MNNEKLENLLNVSLRATNEEREKSQILAEGYQENTKLWEIIVRYAGSLDEVKALSAQIRAVELLGQYAVLWVPEDLVNRLANLESILYVEMPKRLYFALDQAKSVSCVSLVQQGDNRGLTGRGVLIGVADSGIDVTHADFRNNDGSSRIRYLWDQSARTGVAPQGYEIGKEYTNEELNTMLNNPAQTNVLRALEGSGHGTAVAGIAAGNGRQSQGIYAGMAPNSELIVVKLGVAEEGMFPRTTQLMLALDYMVRKSLLLAQPMAINLSFGNNYGSHSGQSLLETYLDLISDIGKLSICVGSGNEGTGAIHTSVLVKDTANSRNPLISVGNQQVYEIPIGVAAYQPSFDIQMWKYYSDTCEITIAHPSGEQIVINQNLLFTQRYRLRNTTILVYMGVPQPYQPWQEIFLDFLPVSDYLDSGLWKIYLKPIKTIQGEYEFWLPAASGLNSGTGFLYPTPEITLTIPSTSSKVITVGAYNSRTLTYAPFSGRGYTNFTEQVKPDLAAPGVGVMTTRRGGDYEAVTGTSFATPFVTGAAALLMQWGIVDGNDAFLYGQKLKAFLHKGARPLPGNMEYPNNQLGWGVLCVSDSLKAY